MQSKTLNKARIKHFLKASIWLFIIKMIITSFVLIIFTLHGCNKNNEKAEPAYASCLDQKITEFNTNDACDNGASVKEYIFQADTVYVFDPGLCGADMISAVLDKECDVLGFLGGIDGNSTINGVEFSDATYLKTIWEN